eukprot:4311093-Prymnesium_polylepis.1
MTASASSVSPNGMCCTVPPRGPATTRRLATTPRPARSCVTSPPRTRPYRASSPPRIRRNTTASPA